AVATNASTKSVEAHNAYLQGHFYFARRNVEDYRKAITFFDQATRLDPDYALAYAERSEAWTFIGDLNTEQKKDAWAAAKRDAEKAVAVGPNLAEAHAALGWVRFFVEWKFAEGLAELRRAKELAPANPTANDLLARVLVYLGQIQEGEKLARQAIELDPLAYLARGNLARILLAEGKLDEADAAARDRKSTRLNSSHLGISYAVFCSKKKTIRPTSATRSRPLKNPSLAFELAAGLAPFGYCAARGPQTQGA